VSSFEDQGLRRGAVVYNSVKERILDGAWQGGDTIVIDQLREEFGTSKQPVMEALRRLAGEGLVEIIPQVGSRVPIWQPEDIADFFEVFAATESEVTAIAVRRRSQAQLARLIDVNERLSEILVLPDDGERIRGYRTLNRDFHGTILRMTHSGLLERTSRRLWDISDLLINTASFPHALSVELPNRYEEHKLIIDAISQRDEDAARKTMRDHILRNIPMLRDAEQGEPAPQAAHRAANSD
jgi:DNA-binding GntR family transcriptional regulator